MQQRQCHAAFKFANRFYHRLHVLSLLEDVLRCYGKLACLERVLRLRRKRKLRGVSLLSQSFLALPENQVLVGKN
jgi:hypothetical protein